MKEYIIVANDEPSIDQLHLELTTSSYDNSLINADIIPNRPVEVADARLANPTITHYFLTDSEARKLSKDPRILAINPLPPKDKIQPHTVEPKFLKKIQKSISFDGHQGNFNRVGELGKYNINWGLRRTSIRTAELYPENKYEYDVNGSGVDIIILDDGIQSNHPEFLDETGLSRVMQYDWYKLTGVPGEMPPRHYVIDGDGQGQHGTHVAAIAAGNTFGYAKNSRIFSMRIFGEEDQVIKQSDIFDLIRIWHNKKPLDRSTGSRRPTIVNISWGYVGTYKNDTEFNQIARIKYRKNDINIYRDPVGRQVEFGQVNDNHGFRAPSVDIEAQQCEDAGVIFVRSAGNSSHKIDVDGGEDYDNYYTISNNWMDFIPAGDPIYYHRGSSPITKNSIIVSSGSNIPILSSNNFKERLDDFSERGPGCLLIAPGNKITSATSEMSNWDTVNNYVWSTAYANKFHVAQSTGTSHASPQVTGVVALYLSRNPSATPQDVKKWLQSVSIKDQLLSNDLSDDWKNTRSLLGGENLYLYNPFHNGYRD